MGSWSVGSFRLARSVALNIVQLDYIEAAKLRGESTVYLITREILPNATAPLAAEFGLRFCFVFLMISSLSFLGLGLQPPTADWGSMVRDNAELISFGDMLGECGSKQLVALRRIVVAHHPPESRPVFYDLTGDLSQGVFDLGNMCWVSATHRVELPSRRCSDREILHELDDSTFTTVMLRVSRKFHV